MFELSVDRFEIGVEKKLVKNMKNNAIPCNFGSKKITRKVLIGYQ